MNIVTWYMNTICGDIGTYHSAIYSQNISFQQCVLRAFTAILISTAFHIYEKKIALEEHANRLTD